MAENVLIKLREVQSFAQCAAAVMELLTVLLYGLGLERIEQTSAFIKDSSKFSLY